MTGLTRLPLEAVGPLPTRTVRSCQFQRPGIHDSPLVVCKADMSA